MKRVTSVLAIAAIFAACSDKPTVVDDMKALNTGVTITDTTGLAEFQQWKTRKALLDQQQLIDEGKTAVVAYEEPAAKPAVRKTSTAKRSSSTARRTSSNRTYSSGSETVYAPAPAPQQQQKKGWSKAAKGAVIGGAGGAVLGGVLAKNNRALGAVIGGVVGGGVGYGIGRGMDKRDGRY